MSKQGPKLEPYTVLVKETGSPRPYLKVSEKTYWDSDIPIRERLIAQDEALDILNRWRDEAISAFEFVRYLDMSVLRDIIVCES